MRAAWAGGEGEAAVLDMLDWLTPYNSTAAVLTQPTTLPPSLTSTWGLLPPGGASLPHISSRSSSRYPRPGPSFMLIEGLSGICSLTSLVGSLPYIFSQRSSRPSLWLPHTSDHVS